uniref:Uncharacterized protein n=1 Tax=Oryza brachyantha TaxID=4533 RepID=J3LV76_ORYBR
MAGWCIAEPFYSSSPTKINTKLQQSTGGASIKQQLKHQGIKPQMEQPWPPKLLITNRSRKLHATYQGLSSKAIAHRDEPMPLSEFYTCTRDLLSYNTRKNKQIGNTIINKACDQVQLGASGSITTRVLHIQSPSRHFAL